MKGTIARCLQDVVVKVAGESVWKEVLTDNGWRPTQIFTPGADLPDEKVTALITTVCEKLNLTIEQAANAFGEHWVTVYAPEVYPSLTKNLSSVREYLESMNGTHERVTRTIANAHPPRFEFEWESDQVLNMRYVSTRNMVEVCAGLVRGLGKMFGESLTVQVLGRDRIRVEWAEAVKKVAV
jgi:hypothetical protein